MISKKGRLGDSLLYVILDKGYLGDRRFFETLKSAVRGKADIIQYRDKHSSTKEAIKTAKRMKAILRRAGIPFIINDRLDVALAADADGIHIGQGDIDISLARKILGKGRMIGVSVKNFKQAVTAKGRGASYLGVGPVFKTPVKSHIKPKGFTLLRRISKLGISSFAIGGINRSNVRIVVDNGFRKIACIRAVCQVKDPYGAVRGLKEAIRK